MTRNKIFLKEKGSVTSESEILWLLKIGRGSFHLNLHRAKHFKTYPVAKVMSPSQRVEIIQDQPSKVSHWADQVH